MSIYSEKTGAGPRLFRLAVLGVASFLILQLITLNLGWREQAILSGVTVLLAMTLNRFSSSRLVTLALMLISITTTLRYAWWRTSALMDFFANPDTNRMSIDSAFMLVLLSCEAYVIVIMILGYMQTMCPLRRKPVSLPDDETLWPHVDVLIPTYNEPLSLVRYTALAANAIDYPPEKLHVFILDDGTREQFQQFARDAGIGYVTRAEHKHAKAGNINHALKRMDSPFVAIFDCDHVPTRSFLQITLGWMLVDPRLAMLQTPHHFYSPDPFQRNLSKYKTIPGEGELFYGLIQDGNDFWDATFFCGSCALMRRTALDDVGGIATETVTEDAHTSLRMQKRGYGTAYINLPQAAGLATETLAAHVGQRIRWARGMIQIFRTDNPLFARGMKFTQRLCYFNAMAHFLYAVPRLIFFMAPLVYMLLGRSVIPGFWGAILAYGFPHLFLSSLTNSRIQERYRHSFWNEIYETVLAPHILAPTVLALINPKFGKFNVTDKGNTLSQTHFDGKISRPTKWMLLLNFLGVLMAPYRLFVKDPGHPGTVIANLAWIIFNMVILGVAAAVAYEQKQRRGSVRIRAKIPVRLRLPDGRQINGLTKEMSVGGAFVSLSEELPLVRGDVFTVAFPHHAGDDGVGARVVNTTDGGLRLAFSATTIGEQETITRALYSRADAWLVSPESQEVDRPLRSLGRVIVLSVQGIYQTVRSFLPDAGTPAKPRAAQTATLIVVACALANSGPGVLGQSFDAQRTAAVTRSREGPDTQHAGMDRAAAKPGDDQADAGQSSQTLSLKDMGVLNDIDMRGPHSFYSASFTLPYDLLPRRAPFHLTYRFSPGLDPHTASLKIAVNGATITTLLPPPSAEPGDGFAEAHVLVPAELLVRSNTLTFEFIGNTGMQREDEARAHTLLRLRASSSLEVSGDSLRLQHNLNQLPLPFFDSELETVTTVRFAFLAQPDTKTLEAAGIFASWLGLLAHHQQARYDVSLGQIPEDDAILLSASRPTLPRSLDIPQGEGPLIALRPNPSRPEKTVLVVAGDNEEQLLTAVRTLSLARPWIASSTGSGPHDQTARIPDLVMPPARNQNDAPRWLQTTKAAPLSSCGKQAGLETGGSRPIPIYFNLPPDLYYGEKENLELQLYYRYNAAQAAKGSALRTLLNGSLINETAVQPGTNESGDRSRLILLPISAMQPFGNTLLFNFDFISSAGRSTEDPPPDSKGEILCQTSIELEGLRSWTRMPNLGLFAAAGFPFTRWADLAATIVILPADPSAEEISLYMQMMSHFGSETGYPALRVTVARPDAVIGKSHDYLILGTVADQPAFHALDPFLPVTLDEHGVYVKPAPGYLSRLSNFAAFISDWHARLLQRPATQTIPSHLDGLPDAMIEEIQSPVSAERSLVLIGLNKDSSASPFAAAFLSNWTRILGSVSLLRKFSFESYQAGGRSYHAGSISWFARMRMLLNQYFLFLLLVVTLLSFVLALWVDGWLNVRARERLKLAQTVSTAD